MSAPPNTPFKESSRTPWTVRGGGPPSRAPCTCHPSKNVPRYAISSFTRTRRLWPRYRPNDGRRTAARDGDLPQPAGRVLVRGPAVHVRAADGLRAALHVVRQRVRVLGRHRDVRGRGSRRGGTSRRAARRDHG